MVSKSKDLAGEMMIFMCAIFVFVCILSMTKIRKCWTNYQFRKYRSTPKCRACSWAATPDLSALIFSIGPPFLQTEPKIFGQLAVKIHLLLFGWMQETQRFGVHAAVPPRARQKVLKRLRGRVCVPVSACGLLRFRCVHAKTAAVPSRACQTASMPIACHLPCLACLPL